MALQPIHIDISNEISDWKNAAKGKDVRQASVKAFTKLQEQTNKSVDYLTEKGSVVDQTVLDVQETRIAAEEAVEYANVISDTSKKYVDNTVGEYKNYADEKLTQTEQKLAEAEASATAAKESSETALGAAETASSQAESAQISAGEAKRYAEQCEGAVGFDGTAQTVSAVDAYELGSDNVQGQLDKLADGIKLPGKNISETNIGTLDTPEEEFPIPETGEKTRTFLGKIKKSMKDWKDFKNGIITLGMLSNQYENSTNKIPTSALVYALKQTTDQLNSKIIYKILWTGKSNTSGDLVNVKDYLFACIAINDSNNSSSSRALVLIPLLNNGVPYFYPAYFAGEWRRIRFAVSDQGILKLIDNIDMYITAIYGCIKV